MNGGLEPWRRVWREGFAPHLSTAGLTALREALRADDHRLVQGATTTPPPLMCVQDWPVEAACAIGFCGWHGSDDCRTVGAVEKYFEARCDTANRELPDGSGSGRHFLNWFDDTPRDEMRRELLAEVELVLASRAENKPEDGRG